MAVTADQLNPASPTDPSFMIGWLRAQLTVTGTITVADWNAALEAERADNLEREAGRGRRARWMDSDTQVT